MIPNLKDLFDGQKINEVSDEQLNEALKKLNEGEPLDNKEKTKIRQNKYRINKELKERGLGKKTTNVLPKEIQAEQSREKLEEIYKKFHRLATGEGIDNADLEGLDNTELKEMIGKKMEQSLNGKAGYEEQATQMFLLTNRLLEYGINKTGQTLADDDEFKLLNGYSNLLKSNKKDIRMCIAEILKSNPELTEYLSPWTRLALICGGCMAGSATHNLSNFNIFRRGEESNVHMETPEDDNNDDNNV